MSSFPGFTQKQRAEFNSVPFFEKHEILIVFSLVVFASIRVFLFSAAFPFFSNVDEQAHFDTVFKYSRGYLPREGDSHFDRASAESIAYYQTMYYLAKPEQFPGGMLPLPLSAFPEENVSSLIDETAAELTQGTVNHEAFSPPAYYMIAGLWFNLGKLFGLDGSGLLYWIRFLNICVIASLTLTAYLFARRFFPENDYLKISLPLTVAFLPQDMFYSINNDVLSPLLFAWSFYLLLDIYFTASPGYWRYLLAGALTAATFLVKFSNIAIIGAFLIILALKMARLHANDLLKRESPKFLLTALSAFLPIMVWLGRNYLELGDLTGDGDKLKALTWSRKPLAEMLPHPILTLKGLTFFWNNLMQTFWSGEFTWHGTPLSSKQAELFYSVSSLVFIAAIAVKTCVFKKEPGNARFINKMCFLVCLLSIVFMIAVSVTFDFGSCFYPSRAYPFLTSGRLISGMLIPFFILYLKGLSIILSGIKKHINPITVVFIIMLSLSVTDLMISRHVFENPYNWFHIKDGLAVTLRD